MFIPNDEILRKYAQVLINFALNSGKGIKKGEVVYFVYDHITLPLAKHVQEVILEAGGHPMSKMTTDVMTRIFYEKANDKQLEFFPKKFSKGLVDTIDQYVRLLGEEDPLFLEGIDPKKMIKSSTAGLPMKQWMQDKEYKGKLTWTLCLYGTEGMAKQANLSLKEYWGQIIKACFLKEDDPVAHWKDVFRQINTLEDRINKLDIDKIHMVSNKTDLWIKLGDKRRFVGGSGRNIPSFEIFTSPDWRGVNGTIFFNFPLFRYGNIIKDIQLTFKDGIVVEASARENEKLLKEMIKAKNADKVGEFSLTDRRFSKIDKFMANTLYDENFGGEFGNTHLAVGSSYNDAYSGNIKTVSRKVLDKLGFNVSAEHCDIISTENRTAEVILKNGKTKLLYADGEFQI